MKLWMSGEIDLDVSDTYRDARKLVELLVNQKIVENLLEIKNFSEWAFIAIIRSDDDPDYDEVVRRDRKRGVLEFRYKVNHSIFAQESLVGRSLLIIEVLKRSVDQMKRLGLTKEEQLSLSSILNLVEMEILTNKPDSAF